LIKAWRAFVGTKVLPAELVLRAVVSVVCCTKIKEALMNLLDGKML
jgi:hypothetical protein